MQITQQQIAKVVESLSKAADSLIKDTVDSITAILDGIKAKSINSKGNYDQLIFNDDIYWLCTAAKTAIANTLPKIKDRDMAFLIASGKARALLDFYFRTHESYVCEDDKASYALLCAESFLITAKDTDFKKLRQDNTAEDGHCTLYYVPESIDKASDVVTMLTVYIHQQLLPLDSKDERIGSR